MSLSTLTVAYLALFALASAGSIIDEVNDHRPLSAVLVLAAHLSGFALVLASALPHLMWLVAPAIPAMLAGGLMWDAWSSVRCARLTAKDPALPHELVSSELVGIGVLLALRLPGYLVGLPLLISGSP
jgi:hypothetical protein